MENYNENNHNKRTFCFKCGRDNSKETKKFCPDCGWPVGLGEIKEETMGDKLEKVHKSIEEKKKKGLENGHKQIKMKFNYVYAILAMLSGIGIIICGVLMLSISALYAGTFIASGTITVIVGVGLILKKRLAFLMTIIYGSFQIIGCILLSVLCVLFSYALKSTNIERLPEIFEQKTSIIIKDEKFNIHESIKSYEEITSYIGQENKMAIILSQASGALGETYGSLTFRDPVGAVISLRNVEPIDQSIKKCADADSYISFAKRYIPLYIFNKVVSPVIAIFEIFVLLSLFLNSLIVVYYKRRWQFFKNSHSESST